MLEFFKKEVTLPKLTIDEECGWELRVRIVGPGVDRRLAEHVERMVSQMRGVTGTKLIRGDDMTREEWGEIEPPPMGPPR